MTELRTNLITLSGADITKVLYDADSFQITDGQPSEPPPMVTPLGGGTFQIQIDCGRSGSTEIANKFNLAARSPYHELTAGYVDTSQPSTDKPTKMNFFFALMVTFSGIQDPVKIYIGQGSLVHLFNNWWIAGEPILNSSPGNSTGAFLMVNPQRIYIVDCPSDEAEFSLRPFRT